MIGKSSYLTVRKIAIPLVLLTGISIVLAYIISRISIQLSLFITVAIFICIISFIKIEYAIYFLLFSMLLSPEIAIGAAGSGESLATSRQLILRLEDLILIIMALSWLARTAIHKELGLILKTPLNKPIGFYILACVFSTFLGAIFGNVEIKTGILYLIKYCEYFVIYFMIVNNIDNERLAKRLINVAFITCLLIAFFAIYQIPAGNRVTAPFEGERGEPNTLGGYLVFMLALALGLTLNLPGIWNQLKWAAFSFILFIPFLYTLSRSSWLAAIPMFFSLLFLSKKRLYIALFLVLFAIILAILSPTSVIERIDYTFNPPYHHNQINLGDSRLDTSASARIISWKRGLKAWIEKPILGYGITGYSFMDAQYVRVLVETGIIGFIAFLWLIISVFKQAWKIFKKMDIPYYKGLTMGYIAGFIALCAHSIGANTFIIIRIMEPFWFFTAIIIILPQIIHRKTKPLEVSISKEAKI